MTDLTFHSLILHDFKSFLGMHKLSLNRDPGLYFVWGRNKKRKRLGSNGAGKTTLWDGLTWVLWDRTGRDANPASSVVPWGAPGAHTWGSVSWTRNGERHKLKRSRNPNELVHKHNGKKRVIEQREVEHLLGMSEEMFQRSVVLSQFGDLFLDLGPAKQSELFNEALDLDVWLVASKRADSVRKDLIDRLTETQKTLSTYKGRRDALKETIHAVQKEFETYEAERRSNKNSLIKRRRGLEGEQSELLDLIKAKSVKHAEERIDKAKKLLKVNEVFQNDMEYALSNLNKLIAEADSVLSKKQGVCPTCGQKLAAKEEHLPNLKKQKVKAEKERNDNTEALKQVGKTIKKQRSDIGTWNDALDRLYKVEREIKDLDHEIKQVSSGTNLHGEMLETHKKQLAGARKMITKIEAECQQQEIDIGECRYWQDAYKEIRISLIDQVLTELEMAVTSHAESLGLEGYCVEFQTERENKKGDVKVAFNVLLHTPERKEPVKWQSYSGGESQRLQLAMAFGLSEIILARAGVSPNIEVLDEPTHHTSDQGVTDLLENLKERAQELGRVIYFVDHHSLDRGDFDGTIVITKDRDGSHIADG